MISDSDDTCAQRVHERTRNRCAAPGAVITVGGESCAGDVQPRHLHEAIIDGIGRDGGPLYVYDSGSIRRMCRAFSFGNAPVSVHFATMANAHPEFLRIIGEEGVKVFVNSLQHLRAVTAAGFLGSSVVYTASAMSDGVMRAVHDTGATVNLDSVGQVGRWTHLIPGAPLGIRCNIGGLVEAKKTRGGYFIGKDSRLGLVPTEIAGLAGHPLVTGLHLYAGTDICSIDYFRHCYETLCGFASLFPNLAYLDFGGGFGLHDETGKSFDFAAYSAMLSSLVASVNQGRSRPLSVILEPGRIIGARAGYFACTVVDVKEVEGSRRIGVNASSAQFPRPLFYPDAAAHPTVLLHADGTVAAGPGQKTSVYGCSTYSRDFLAYDTMLPEASFGDIIVFGEAGSYCASMHTGFLGFPPAREIFL